MMFKNNKLFIFLIIISLIFLFISIFYTMNYYVKLPKTTQDTLLSKISPPLLSAFVSAIVAFTIFFLTKLKEENTKKYLSNIHTNIICEEINKNINSLSPISTIFKQHDIAEISNFLNENQQIKETFSFYYSIITIDIIDKFIVQLEEKDFRKISEIYSDYKTLVKLLEKITQTDSQEIRIKFLEKIKILLENIPKELTELKNDEPIIPLTLKQLIWSLVIFGLVLLIILKL